ncbi:MAG: bifunctional phosphoribosylaminoimidazolecarboxamide formyltransferase/IMP cyclohydrolase [Thermoplasmatota archaeon]
MVGGEVRLALLSVWNKQGVADFARELAALGVELVSTGGTLSVLREAGLEVRSVSDLTGFPEALEGRVKTLHPAIHAGILARRDSPAHLAELERLGIRKIDLVAVNLYPFEATVGRPDCTLEEALESIDIGGPAMLRASAKNFEGVVPICSPDSYPVVIEELKSTGAVSIETRRRLALEAFAHTAAYDAAVASRLPALLGLEERFPSRILLTATKVLDLRYGENPHQRAALYRDPERREPCAAFGEVLHGKLLSFNNYLDLDAALELVKEFTEPAATIVKHTSPSGVAVRASILEAYRAAHAADPRSAYGGVVALNRACDRATAEQIASSFIEAVVAPDFEGDALSILRAKKSIRLVRVGPLDASTGRERLDIKRIVGGFLVQERDLAALGAEDLRVVTKKHPSGEELRDLLFARLVVKHVKSNAVVFARGLTTTGIGAGQQSRVDGVAIAVRKGGERIRGSVLASDAFFPFRDGVDEAAGAGVSAILQPGGSVRDGEVVAAADEHGVAMVFSGLRSFRH